MTQASQKGLQKYKTNRSKTKREEWRSGLARRHKTDGCPTPAICLGDEEVSTRAAEYVSYVAQIPRRLPHFSLEMDHGNKERDQLRLHSRGGTH